MQNWNKEGIFRHIDLSSIEKCLYPIHIELQPTNICNLECVFCNSKHQRKNLVSVDLDSIIFFIENLIKTGLKSLTIEGGGEPSLYPYLNELINHFYKKIDIGIITNGTNFLSDNILEKLNWIRVSLDSCSEEEYIEKKGKHLFKSVLKNIEYFSKYRSNLSLGISYIVPTMNEIYIEKVYSFLDTIKSNIDYVQFKSKDNKVFHSIEKYKRTHYPFEIYTIDCTRDGKIIYDNECNKCYSGQLSSTINPNGDVLFCKRMDIPVVIGNIYHNSIEEIYQGVIKKSLLKTIMKNNSLVCTLPCRFKKYNYVIEKALENNTNTKNFF